MLCSRSTVVFGVALSLIAGVVSAAPISVRIDDHDFTFDVAQDAVYDYAGAGPDHLFVHNSSGHYAGQYTYTGVMPTVPATFGGVPPAASVDPYPIYSGSPVKFAGNLDLDMFFVTNDGPYTNPFGDTFAVSLNGTEGSLRITGKIATQGFPPAALYPVPWNDITLLDIQFDRVTLLSRAGWGTIDLIEGIGTVKTLLGINTNAWQGGDELSSGGTFFKFIAPAGTSIFPIGSVYDPLAPDSQGEISGRISGEAGVIIPEPGTLTLLVMGAVFAFRRRG